MKRSIAIVITVLAFFLITASFSFATRSDPKSKSTHHRHTHTHPKSKSTHHAHTHTHQKSKPTHHAHAHTHPKSKKGVGGASSTENDDNGGGFGEIFGPGGGFNIPGFGGGSGYNGGYGGGFGGPKGGYAKGGIIRPSVVCKEKGPCLGKKLTCPAKCFKSFNKAGKGYGYGGGGGGCTMDCKKKCVAYC